MCKLVKWNQQLRPMTRERNFLQNMCCCFLFWGWGLRLESKIYIFFSFLPNHPVQPHFCSHFLLIKFQEKKSTIWTFQASKLNLFRHSECCTSRFTVQPANLAIRERRRRFFPLDFRTINRMKRVRRRRNRGEEVGWNQHSGGTWNPKTISSGKFPMALTSKCCNHNSHSDRSVIYIFEYFSVYFA